MIPGQEIYGLNQARRSKVIFEKAAKEAHVWYIFWTVLAYVFDFLTAGTALAVAVTGQIKDTPLVVMTVLGAIIVLMKTIETFGQFKPRATRAKITYYNYRSVAGKIEDAFAVLEHIAVDGVTIEELQVWSKMTHLIQELAQFASQWSTTPNSDVSSAIGNLQNIERGIIRQGGQSRPHCCPHPFGPRLVHPPPPLSPFHPRAEQPFHVAIPMPPPAFPSPQAHSAHSFPAVSGEKMPDLIIPSCRVPGQEMRPLHEIPGAPVQHFEVVGVLPPPADPSASPAPPF